MVRKLNTFKGRYIKTKTIKWGLPTLYPELTASQRKSVREQYMVEQDGKCSHCGEYLSLPPRADIQKKHTTLGLFPDGFFKYPVHLHHDHKSGLTIGAVHAKCNAVLWQHHGE